MGDLLERRMAANPELTPLPKLKMPSPAIAASLTPLPKRKVPCPVPTVLFKNIIITDGVEEQVQVKYSNKGCEYPTVAPGTRFYYTRGALPAMVVKAKARKAQHGQLVLQLSVGMDELIKAMLTTCHPLRYAVQRDATESIRGNFYPSAGCQGEWKSIVYLKESIQWPLSSFQSDEEYEVYLFPSACAYNREKRLFKCRLDAIPVQSCGILNIAERKYDEDQDYTLDIPASELNSMVELFLLKWRQEEEEYDAAAVTRAIFI